MKKCAIIVANPNPQSFTNVLVNSFKSGLTDAGADWEILDLFGLKYSAPNEHVEENAKVLLATSDLVLLAFPWWCEMPPYPLVGLMQRILVEGFAYTRDENGTKIDCLDLPTFMLVTMGQNKECNLSNMTEALDYVGLHVNRYEVANNVGPKLDQQAAQQYLAAAYNLGRTAPLNTSIQ